MCICKRTTLPKNEDDILCFQESRMWGEVEFNKIQPKLVHFQALRTLPRPQTQSVEEKCFQLYLTWNFDGRKGVNG